MAIFSMKSLNNETPLNPEQLKAVTHGDGSLLIIAGAGTGKTKVITHRIAHLIEKGVNPNQILALTFTEKAAGEMEERVDRLVPYGYSNVWISTFHSFGDRVLRDNVLEIGLTPDFKVLSEAERIIFLKEHLFELPLNYYRPLGNPTRYLSAITGLISRLKDEDVGVDEYRKYAEDLKKSGVRSQELEPETIQQDELAKTYAKYQELMARNGYLDFGDQVVLPLKLFRTRPHILKRYQEKFQYILVDEFQDTNYAQFQLVRLLSERHKNINVVADDDQCLPPDTLVETPNGPRKIEDIKTGEEVITAVGKGYTAVSKAAKVFKKRKMARFLTFETEKGHKITVTDNHKMFCYVPSVADRKDIYYVYLMHRKNLGWRLGVTNDLAGRLRLERSADRIVGLKGFRSEEEAYYHEVLWSLNYGVPTVCFMERKGIRMTGEWLNRLYTEVDTDRNVMQLAKDLRIDLTAHHVSLDGVNRGNSKRVKVNIEMCYRKYGSKAKRGNILKRPVVSHMVSLQTSDEETIKKLEASGIHLRDVKKGKQFRFANIDIRQIGDMAQKLGSITDGILETKFSVGTMNIQHKPALVMPASNVLLGHYLPVTTGAKVIYDRVINISEDMRSEIVYDLEIERTHNFIANNVVIHNSIYKFRGAAISNVLGFQKIYPDAKLITLTKNYRSVQPILDSAYRLISHNNPDRLEVKSGIDKRLLSAISYQPSSVSVKHLHFDTLTKEAETVAEMIERKVASCRMPDAGKNLKLETCDFQLSYKDFAILVRANSDAEPFLKALKDKGIPHRFSGNQGLYSREEIRLLIAFLKAITDFNDSMSLFHLASSEVYQVKAEDLIPCHNISRQSHKPLYYVMREIAQQVSSQQSAVSSSLLTNEGLATITKLVGDIEKYSEMALNETVGRVLYSFLTSPIKAFGDKDTSYLTRLSEENSAIAVEKVQNIAKFFEITQHMEATLSVKRVAAFVEYLNILMEAGDNPGTAEPDVEADWVQVLTVHKAKGLEFPVVFMVGLVSERFPRKGRSEEIPLPDALIKDMLPSGDFHLQEERRLFYVGMTRAMNELYLTSASDYGGVRAKKISQFVLEALDMPKAETTTVKTKPIEAIKRFAPTEGTETELLPIPNDASLSLSYYQIDDYTTCPLKYKYVHILKVPLLPHHTIMYGKAMHDVISTYFRRKAEGKTPGIDELMSIFNASWRSAGFVTKEHELQRYEAGKEAIKKFYEAQEKDGIKPAAIEREFLVDLGANRLKGRWDLIEERKDGPYIIDFKTSDVREEKAANKKAKESIQLMLYALAYRENFKKLPAGCELHFVESGLVGKAVFEEKHIEKALNMIDEVAKGIRTRDYAAKPDYRNCDYCAFNNICPATAR